MAAPTFEAIEFYAKAANAEVVKIPLAASYSHQLVQMAEAVGKDGGLIYICNPNNPTASVTPRRSLEIFIRSLPPNTYVLMDEAYHDFVPVAADYISFLATPIDPRPRDRGAYILQDLWNGRTPVGICGYVGQKQQSHGRAQA